MCICCKYWNCCPNLWFSRLWLKIPKEMLTNQVSKGYWEWQQTVSVTGTRFTVSHVCSCNSMVSCLTVWNRLDCCRIRVLTAALLQHFRPENLISQGIFYQPHYSHFKMHLRSLEFAAYHQNINTIFTGCYMNNLVKPWT